MTTPNISAADLIPQKKRALNADFSELFKWDRVGAMVVGKIVGDVTRPDKRGKPWRTLTLSPVVIVPAKAGEPVLSFADLAITATANISQALPLVKDNPTDYRGKCYGFHYEGESDLGGGETLKRILVYDWTVKGFAELIEKLGETTAKALLPLLDDGQEELPF